MRKGLGILFALMVVTGAISILAVEWQHVRATGPTYVTSHITVNTTWTIEGSPYIISGNITVGNNAVLTIEPGVAVKFNFSNTLFVDGALVAVGDETNPIILTSNMDPPKPGDWIAIAFNDSSDDVKSMIKHSIIEYSKNGVWCDGASPSIVNNTIRRAMRIGIYAQESNATIEGNTMTDISITGIEMYKSHPRIANNSITTNGNYGISGYESSPMIENNTISDSIDGINLQYSQPAIVGNEITSTSYAVRLDYSPDAVISDNKVTGNGYGVYLVHSNATSILRTEMSNNNYGIYTLSSVSTITNSSIKNSSLRDLFLGEESHMTTLNTTFRDDSLFILDGSELVVRNYLAVSVRNKENNPIEGALTEVNDNDATAYSIQSDKDGLCEWMIATDRVYKGSITAIENETNVDVSYESLVFLDNPRDVDMSVSHTEIFKVQNLILVINITSPTLNESVWRTKTVEGSASDSDGRIVAVELKIGQEDWQLLNITPGQTVQWNHTWDTWTTPNGTVYIFVRAVDSDGDWNATSIYVQVDNYGPIVEVISHSDHDVVSGLVEIIGQTSDERGNVTSVMVSIDDEPWVMATMQETNWSRWAYTLDTRELTNGEHVISIRAQDDQPANSTISLVLSVNNPKPVTQVMDWFFLILVLTVIAIILLVVFATRKRARSRTEADKAEEREVEIPLDERIERLKKAYEDGLISREIYELNLAKLGAEETETTRQSTGEEAISYMCPKCDNEVDADATRCDNCGAVFED